jgi:hypothetical protein
VHDAKSSGPCELPLGLPHGGIPVYPEMQMKGGLGSESANASSWGEDRRRQPRFSTRAQDTSVSMTLLLGFVAM